MFHVRATQRTAGKKTQKTLAKLARPNHPALLSSFRELMYTWRCIFFPPLLFGDGLHSATSCEQAFFKKENTKPKQNQTAPNK